MAACVLLGACASSSGGGAPSSADARGLFRTPSRVGGLAPAPSAGWYVPRQNPRYVKMGLARPRAEAERRGWVARLFGGKAATAKPPSAVIAETASLPLPSVVQITNVTTGAAIKVRIDERAPMGEDLVRLNPAAAQALGVSHDRPLLVRVRFVEPAIAYREGPGLAYAFNRQTPSKTQLAAAPPSPPPAPAEAPIVTARAEAPEPQPTTAAVAPPEPPRPAVVAPVSAFRIQAGAFADPGNARRAVAMLAPAGRASIEPTQRGSLTLYRVFLDSSGNAGAAEALRARVAQIGFADARIVRAS